MPNPTLRLTRRRCLTEGYTACSLPRTRNKRAHLKYGLCGRVPSVHPVLDDTGVEIGHIVSLTLLADSSGGWLVHEPDTLEKPDRSLRHSCAFSLDNGDLVASQRPTNDLPNTLLSQDSLPLQFGSLTTDTDSISRLAAGESSEGLTACLVSRMENEWVRGLSELTSEVEVQFHPLKSNCF